MRREPNKRKLTALTIAKARPATRAYLLWDTLQRGWLCGCSLAAIAAMCWCIASAIARAGITLALPMPCR
jgi:hypothetical protein